MLVLLAFALLAGAGTALTPCVLPVLPAVLTAGATGGRRRPLGVVLGLATTHALSVVVLASVVAGVGVAGDLARRLAIAVLLAAGLALLVPAVGARVEAALAPLARLVPARPGGAGTGFASGFGLGAALGLLYAPCAGPILAAVVSVGATRGVSGELVAVAIAYAGGSALVLLVLALGGRRLAARIREAGRGPVLQRALGAVLALTAAAMLAGADLRLGEALAEHAPAALADPTRALERSRVVERELTALRGPSRFAEVGGTDAVARGALHGVRTPRLPRLGAAPELTGTGRWFNSAPTSLARLRGRVVLVDFWTYTCINCVRTLPFLRALDERYRAAGLTVLGVHTPEFSFERRAGNVGGAVERQRLRYPVVQDNAYATWQAWGNQFWPAEYLVDGRGEVRRAHFGEGGYREQEAAVRALLLDAGARRLPAPITARPEVPSAKVATPETYLGSARAERWVVAPRRGVRSYPPAPARLGLSAFALSGRWAVTPEGARAASVDARVTTTVQAQKVFLVMSSTGGRARTVAVRLDGRRRPGVRVARQELYRLVALPRPGRHRLELRVPPGVTGYAFTFG